MSSDVAACKRRTSLSEGVGEIPDLSTPDRDALWLVAAHSTHLNHLLFVIILGRLVAEVELMVSVATVGDHEGHRNSGRDRHRDRLDLESIGERHLDAGHDGPQSPRMLQPQGCWASHRPMSRR